MIWLAAFAALIAGLALPVSSQQFASFIESHCVQGAYSRLSFEISGCNISEITFPLSFSIGNIAIDNQTVEALHITSRSFKDGYAVMTSAFFIAADYSTPVCQGRCCIAQHGKPPGKEDSSDPPFAGICRLAPNMLPQNPLEPENFFELAAPPQKGCPRGLRLTRYLPAMILLVSPEISAAAIDHVLSYTVFFAPSTSEFTWADPISNFSAELPGDGITHLILWRQDRILRKALLSNLTNINDEAEEQLDDASAAYPFTRPNAFSLLLALSLAILCQPQGSMLHRNYQPWFWRLVPFYGIIESLLLVALYLWVAYSSRARNVRAFCAAVLLYRDHTILAKFDQYSSAAGPSMLDMNDSAAPSESLKLLTGTRQLIATATILPVLAILAKLSTVQGAEWVSAFGILLAIPWFFLQLVILCGPTSMTACRLPHDQGSQRAQQITKALSEIRKMMDGSTSTLGDEEGEESPRGGSTAQSTSESIKGTSSSSHVARDMFFEVAVCSFVQGVCNLVFEVKIDPMLIGKIQVLLWLTWLWIGFVVIVCFFSVLLSLIMPRVSWQDRHNVLFMSSHLVMGILHLLTWSLCLVGVLFSFSEMDAQWPGWVEWLG